MTGQKMSCQCLVNVLSYDRAKNVVSMSCQCPVICPLICDAETFPFSSLFKLQKYNVSNFPSVEISHPIEKLSIRIYCYILLYSSGCDIAFG